MVTDAFGKFLDCGTLERGFAWIRCDHGGNEHLDFHPLVHALVADGLLDSDGPVNRAPGPLPAFCPNSFATVFSGNWSSTNSSRRNGSLA